MFRKARKTLVAWNVFVLVLILSVLCGAIYELYYHQVYTSVDQELKVEGQKIATRLVLEQGALSGLYVSPPFDFGYRVVVADPSGWVDMSTDCMVSIGPSVTPCLNDSRLLASKDGFRTALASGSDMRTASFRGSPQRVYTYTFAPDGQPIWVIQISRLAEGEETSLEKLRLMLIVGGLLGVFLSGLGSLFLANRALVPIREAFTRQRQFTADASHELRTPLAIIRANAEMVARHGDRLLPSDNESVTDIIRETDHLNRLVGDLLTLARADAEQVQIQMVPVDFRALVEEVHDDVQRIAESRGIESKISLNGPVSIEGDETRLRQLLLILLDNALKYTDPGGNVDMALEREDSKARLLVTDTGIGIPASDVPRIFDRFYRVDRAREHESGGTGLGLAIAQWIVTAHHGQIKVDSEIGRGTKFVVELPVGSHNS